MPAGPAAPDDAAAISAIAGQHGRAAIDALVDALDSQDPGERVAAAVALLNVGYGQPVQPIALDSAHGISIELSEALGQRANGEDDDAAAAWSARRSQRDG
jgi:hypothetical protein